MNAWRGRCARAPQLPRLNVCVFAQYGHGRAIEKRSDRWLVREPAAALVPAGELNRFGQNVSFPLQLLPHLRELPSQTFQNSENEWRQVMRQFKSTIAAFALAVTIVAPSMAADESAQKNIVETAVAAGSFQTLVAAVQAADLAGALAGKGPFTVFAPTDDAFAKLPKEVIQSLLKPENKQQLAGILTYHVVKGHVLAAQVVDLPGAVTLNGQRVDIQVKKDKVMVDGATVVKTDIKCSNGVIHVIDKVILPADKTIPETAEAAGKFGTLLAAANAAGLAEALSGKGPFTVFAPTDEAFAKLPKGTVESLLKPENKSKLAAILKYHVVPGRVYSTQALDAGKAKTLQGGTVVISANEKKATVNDATLVATDLDASNGVIHVIDSVLLPKADGNAQMHPRKMIEMAIAEGAPLYNAGHPGACAKVYMTTVENLLAADGGQMCSTTTHRLQTALDSARRTSCADSQAWALRHALDAAHSTMAAAR